MPVLVVRAVRARAVYYSYLSSFREVGSPEGSPEYSTYTEQERRENGKVFRDKKKKVFLKSRQVVVLEVALIPVYPNGHNSFLQN